MKTNLRTQHSASNSPQQPLQIPIGLMATPSTVSKAVNVSNSSVTVSLTPSSKANLVGLGYAPGVHGGHHQGPPPMVLEDREEIIPFSQAPSAPAVIVTPAPLNGGNLVKTGPPMDNGGKVEVTGPIQVVSSQETAKKPRLQ